MLRCRPSELGMSLADLDEASQRMAIRKEAGRSKVRPASLLTHGPANSHARIHRGAERSRDDAVTHFSPFAGHRSCNVLDPRSAEVLTLLDNMPWEDFDAPSSSSSTLESGSTTDSRPAKLVSSAMTSNRVGSVNTAASIFSTTDNCVSGSARSESITAKSPIQSLFGSQLAVDDAAKPDSLLANPLSSRTSAPPSSSLIPGKHRAFLHSTSVLRKSRKVTMAGTREPSKSPVSNFPSGSEGISERS